MAKTKFEKLDTIARCQAGIDSLEDEGEVTMFIDRLLCIMERAYEAGRNAALDEAAEDAAGASI